MEKVAGGYLRYDRDSILAVDEGRFRISYKGTVNGQPVVVNKTALREIETLTTDENLLRIRHANVASIQNIEKDEDFRYDVVEEYAASLDCYFLRNDNPKKYTGPMPSNDKVLLQLAKGLDYLHSQNILHGDIKPENILISSTTPVQMKWTGFGFRRSRVNYSVTTNVTTRMAPRKWWPPEMYQDDNMQSKEGSKEGEIFSSGCVFLYLISGGLHPFASADLEDLASNVIEGRPVNLIGPNSREASSTTQFTFVENMIKKIPRERIPLWEVILCLENQQRQDLNTEFPFSSLQYEERGYENNGRCFYGELCLRIPEGLAVKRIPKDFIIAAAAEMSALGKLNHSNVVHFFECYEDSRYKYFSMEYCSASLDHVFLSKGDPKKYVGPMPSHEQFFLQMLNGLQYIHEKSNLVHGSIKPSNILINGTEDPQIKLADFGLIIPQWEINSGSPVSFHEFQSEQYWLAPELLTILTNPELNGTVILLKPAKESDIFATGKVFFYYYYQSYAELLMPNGIDANIPDGQYVFKKCPMNSRPKDKNQRNGNLIQLIDDMTKEENHERLKLPVVIESVKSFNLTPQGKLEEPKDSKSGNIKFSREFILGEGNYGKVHLGLWGGSIAAVKRILISLNDDIVIERENELQKLNHRNVVRFYDSEQDSDFKYIVMEKCLTSVDSYCRQSKLYRGAITMPSDINVLLEMATGLQYIHSRNLIHRDVKPGNILISYGNPAVIKWTDFGVSKETRKKHAGEDVVTWTARQGTKGWKAPEVEKNEVVKAGEKSDIFSLGCVFFFFLTPAIHPFGKDSKERRKNIISYSSGNEPININELPKHHFAFTVIKEMLQLEEHARPKISKVIEDLEAACP